MRSADVCVNEAQRHVVRRGRHDRQWRRTAVPSDLPHRRQFPREFSHRASDLSPVDDGTGESSFDVIHNNSLHYLVVAMAARLEVPMVTLLHTPPFWEMEGSVRAERRGQQPVRRRLADAATAWQPIIAVAEVVPNGIDLEHFRFRAKPHEPAYLVWTGRIVPEKGLHVALQAAAALGMELRIAGPIADALYYAAEIAPRLGTTSRYLGHLPHEALVSVVAARLRVCSRRCGRSRMAWRWSKRWPAVFRWPRWPMGRCRTCSMSHAARWRRRIRRPRSRLPSASP